MWKYSRRDRRRINGQSTNLWVYRVEWRWANSHLLVTKQSITGEEGQPVFCTVQPAWESSYNTRRRNMNLKYRRRKKKQEEKKRQNVERERESEGWITKGGREEVTSLFLYRIRNHFSSVSFLSLLPFLMTFFCVRCLRCEGERGGNRR